MEEIERPRQSPKTFTGIHAPFFLSAVFEGIGEQIIVMDQDFVVLDANSAFLKEAGLQREQVLGRKCHEVKEWAGKPCRLENGSCPLELARKAGKKIEATHYHKTPRGEMRETFLLMYPLKGKPGETDYFIEITRDVTEYRNLMVRLQNSEKRLRAFLDTAPSAILCFDEDQSILLFNDGARIMFGYSPEEILGKELQELISPVCRDQCEFIRRFRDEKQSCAMRQSLQLTALRKGGEEFPIELNLSYMEIEGKFTFTAIIRDTSEVRGLENKLLQSERFAAVGQAVAYVAHELRNPLMVIGGFAGQVRMGLTDPKDMLKMDMILDEVRRLESLVAGIGDFTKTYRPCKRRTDLSAVIKEVLEIIAGVYPIEKYTFKEEYSPDFGEIFCDPDKLKQVFLNLLANGCEAMPGGGSVTISAARNPSWIEIRVLDHGKGLPKERIQRLFEPFYTTKEKGLGLGLPICYKIVQAHGGEIYAESQPGKGTCFVVRIPEDKGESPSPGA